MEAVFLVHVFDALTEVTVVATLRTDDDALMMKIHHCL